MAHNGAYDDFVDMYHKHNTTVDKVEGWVRNIIGHDVDYSISMDAAYKIYHLSGIKQEIAIYEEAYDALQRLQGQQLQTEILLTEITNHLNTLRIQDFCVYSFPNGYSSYQMEPIKLEDYTQEWHPGESIPIDKKLIKNLVGNEEINSYTGKPLKPCKPFFELSEDFTTLSKRLIKDIVEFPAPVQPKMQSNLKFKNTASTEFWESSPTSPSPSPSSKQVAKKSSKSFKETGVTVISTSTSTSFAMSVTGRKFRFEE